THGTWSNMVASASNRKIFIDSLLVFMAKYGFQGVDLDWEYPVAEDRGGAEDDTENFVALVKEMRVAFGTQYGISVALAPDIWYLRCKSIAPLPYPLHPLRAFLHPSRAFLHPLNIFLYPSKAVLDV